MQRCSPKLAEYTELCIPTRKSLKYFSPALEYIDHICLSFILSWAFWSLGYFFSTFLRYLIWSYKLWRTHLPLFQFLTPYIKHQLLATSIVKNIFEILHAIFQWKSFWWIFSFFSTKNILVAMKKTRKYFHPHQKSFQNCLNYRFIWVGSKVIFSPLYKLITLNEWSVGASAKRGWVSEGVGGRLWKRRSRLRGQMRLRRWYTCVCSCEGRSFFFGWKKSWWTQWTV